MHLPYKSKYARAAHMALDLILQGEDGYDALTEACAVFHIAKENAHFVEARLYRLLPPTITPTALGLDQ